MNALGAADLPVKADQPLSFDYNLLFKARLAPPN